MKPFATLLLVLGASASAFAGDFLPRTISYKAFSGSPNYDGSGTMVAVVQLGTGEPRHFELIVKKVMGSGAAASGTFLENGEQVQAGEFFVRGLSADAVDGARVSVWLERQGFESYQRSGNAPTTVAAYRVIPAPVTPPPPKRDPFADFGKTLLEQRPPPRR